MAVTTGIQPSDDKTSLKGRHVETIDNEKRTGSDVGDEEISEEDNIRLRRRIDWFIMPLLCLVYGLQYVSGRCWGGTERTLGERAPCRYRATS